MMRNRFLAAATVASLGVSLVVAPSADAAQVSQPENKICSVSLTNAEDAASKQIISEGATFYQHLIQAHLNVSEDMYPGARAIGQKMLKSEDFLTGARNYAHNLANSPAKIPNQKGGQFSSTPINSMLKEVGPQLRDIGMSSEVASEFVHAVYFMLIARSAYDFSFPKAFAGEEIPGDPERGKDPVKIDPWAFRVGDNHPTMRGPKLEGAVRFNESDYWLVAEYIDYFEEALPAGKKTQYRTAIREAFNHPAWKSVNEFEIALSKAAVDCGTAKFMGSQVAFPTSTSKPAGGESDNSGDGGKTTKPGEDKKPAGSEKPDPNGADGAVDDQGSSLSTPAIIGIVVAVIAALGGLGAAWFNFMGNTPAFKLPF